METTEKLDNSKLLGHNKCEMGRWEGVQWRMWWLLQQQCGSAGWTGEKRTTDSEERQHAKVNLRRIKVKKEIVHYYKKKWEELISNLFSWEQIEQELGTMIKSTMITTLMMMHTRKRVKSCTHYVSWCTQCWMDVLKNRVFNELQHHERTDGMDWFQIAEQCVSDSWWGRTYALALPLSSPL